MFRHLFETARKYLLLRRSWGHALQEIDAALHMLARGEADIRLSGIDRPDDIGRLSSTVCFLAEAVRSRQRAAEELRASLAEKSGMLDQIPVGVLAERDGLIVACNSSLERLFGYTRSELSGRHSRNLYANNADFDRIDAAARQARLRGEQYSGEAALQRKDGTTFWGALTVGATSAGASNTWVYNDISDAKRTAAAQFERSFRLEQLLAERTHLLEEAGQRAACIAGTRASPESGRSHETRYPGDSNIELLSFDPASMVEGVAALAAPMAEERGLELVLEIDSRLPRSLLGAPLPIAQVLTNLLGNAIRSTKQGDVVVSVREARRENEKLLLEFRVRERGCGAAREREAASLKATDQAGGASTIRRAGRRKFGLAISKRLVESMGSTLAVESQYGEGNTFHFTAEFEIATQAGNMTEFYAEQLRARAGRSVMLIDDNRSARLAAAALLSRLGLAPVLFESGAAALASLLRQGVPEYLFICIDRRMPELDGLEVARRLHAHYGRGCPPLLLMTAFSHATELQGAEHGFAAVVSKPLTIDRLYSHIAAVLGMPDPGPEASPAPGLKGKCVLLVQDDGTQQEIMADFLRGAGLTVRIASNALEALQAVREITPDCIMLDCRLPDMDACELTRRLRALGCTQLPIIGLGPGSQAADAANCLAAGMSEFIAKPVALPALLGILARWMVPSVSAVVPTDGEALPPLPPELDVEAGLRHLRGKTTLFLKALRMFRDSCGQKFQLEFRLAVRAGDWRTSERLAHSLKGTAATIGANQVSAVAARLEAAIRSSDYAEANALLAELTEKLQVLVEGLAHIG